MNVLLPVLCSILLAQAPQIDSRFEQTAPVPPNGQPARSSGQTRAVVLLHGFIFHFRESSVGKAGYRDWQKPGSLLVTALHKDSDVYSFGYAQNASLDDIIKHGKLLEAIGTLKALGYREIVLLGHSAGGLIARQLVEDNPQCGVTKVIQICAPNGGTPAAKTNVHASQQAFVNALTADARAKTLKDRADKRIPAQVEFVCLLGYMEGKYESDGLIPCACQWTDDLRKQCVPVIPVEVSHHQATRSMKGAEVLARLVREKQPRWDAARAKKTSRELFSK